MARRRNNFTSTNAGGVRPFAGRGFASGYRPSGRSYMSRVGQAIGAAATMGIPFATAYGRQYLKRKAGGFATSTAKKTKKGETGAPLGLVQLDGANNTRTLTNFPYRKNRLSPTIKALCAPQYYPTNDSFGETCGVGVQGGASYDWLATGDLTNIMAIVGASSVNANSQRAVIEKLEGDLTVSNSSAAAASIVIYDIIAKRDCSVTNVANPLAAWQNGLSDEGGTGTSWETVGSIPTESVLFSQFYRIVKETRVEMQPGGMHRHSVCYDCNKFINNEWLKNVNYGLQDLTCFSLLVVHGTPAHDSTTESVVTTAPIRLDVVKDFTVTYRYILQAATSWSRVNNLASSFPVGQQQVNQQVGQFQDAAGLHPGQLT